MIDREEQVIPVIRIATIVPNDVGGTRLQNVQAVLNLPARRVTGGATAEWNRRAYRARVRN